VIHESPGLVIIYFVRLPNRTLPFVFSGETIRLCMGESENPNRRLRSHLELWSRSWHGWFLEQSFLVRKLFYNDTFVDVLFRGLDGDRKSSRCLPNTSTFVPNDRSQCLYCVLPIMRCAFGAHIDIGLAERQTPSWGRWKSHVFFPLSEGRWPSLIRRNRNLQCRSPHPLPRKSEVPVKVRVSFFLWKFVVSWSTKSGGACAPRRGRADTHTLLLRPTAGPGNHCYFSGSLSKTSHSILYTLLPPTVTQSSATERGKASGNRKFEKSLWYKLKTILIQWHENSSSAP